MSGKDSKARRVSEMFGRIAGRYDLLNALMTVRQDARWRAVTVRLAAVDSNGPLLDVATGSGDLALALAAANPAARICAVDFCAPMLDLARRKIERQGRSDQIDLVLGDAQDLPFPDNTFASATMGFALRNVSDIPRTLSEIHRVLRPGARLANLELTPLRPSLRANLFRLYFHRCVPLLGALVAGDFAAYRYLPNSLDGFLAADALADLARQAGFGAVSYKVLGGGTVAVHVGVKAVRTTEPTECLP